MHTVGVSAAIIDGGQALLIHRRDSPLWALPGGTLDPGETVTNCCLREAKEETGLDVEIERLVGLYARRRGMGCPIDINFLFACRVTGGDFRTSTETSAVRYWPLQKLPRNVPGWHRRYLADAAKGAPSTTWYSLSTPVWTRLATRLLFGVRAAMQRLHGRPRYISPCWALGTFATLFDEAGSVLLVKRRDFPAWNLPGGGVEDLETPWGAAVRETREETGLEIALKRLVGVYAKPLRGELVFSFEGHITGGWLRPTDEGAESRFFPLDALPDAALPKHVERVYDAATGASDVIFKLQESPPGLQVLGLTQS